MSMDGLDNPIGNMERPKSSKKIWIFGGLGCLGLIGVLCIGGGAFVWISVFKPAVDFTNENIAIIEASFAAEAVLGAPIIVGQPTTSTSGQQVILQGSVSGPNASGTYVVKATLEGMTLKRDEIYLEVDGERIDLDAEEMFDLGISEGQ